MVSKHTQAWQIDESEYNALTSLKDKVAFFVRYAILAPSPWNSQPWKFKVENNRLDIYEVPERWQVNRDPECREQVLSCGAAIANVALAAEHFGLQSVTQFCPPGAPEHCLGSVIFAERDIDDPGIPTPEEKAQSEALFRAITKRHSHRHDFTEQLVDESLITEMVKIASEMGVSFVPLSNSSTKLALAGMVAEGDRYLEANQATREEYASWIRRNENKGDGVPGYALGMGKVASMLAPVTHRFFDYTDEHARKDSQMTSAHALIGVFMTADDQRPAWMTCGAALQHVLLYAVSHGIQASFLNQPIPVPELRQRLSDLLGSSEIPHAIVRLGYPTELDIKPTPRLPLEDVMMG